MKVSVYSKRGILICANQIIQEFFIQFYIYKKKTDVGWTQSLCLHNHNQPWSLARLMCAYNGFVLLVNNDVLVENTKWRARSALLLLWSLGILRIHCRNLHTHTRTYEIWRCGPHYSLQTFHEYTNQYNLIGSEPVLKYLLEQRWILCNAEKTGLVWVMFQTCSFNGWRSRSLEW